MRKMLFIISAALLVGLAACTSSGTPTPTPSPKAQASAAPRDLTVRLRNMTPHVGQLVELRVLSSDDQLQARAVLDPLAAVDVDVVIPKAVPTGGGRLDFYADLNKNGKYDAPPADHAWRLVIAAGTDAVTIDFSHNTSFTDISVPVVKEPGDKFLMKLTGMIPHVGQLFEVRVIEKATGRTVGGYRLGQVSQPAFDVTIPGIIKSGTEYQIDFFADLNKNGKYDAPPADHAWRLTGTGGANGLTVEFTHNTSFTDTGF